MVTAPGPGSGKMATCLSNVYHDFKRGIKSGYAKYETFPVWNLPLKHPVNVAYEAATADLNDVNMIDPWHLSAYGVTTVNYESNRKTTKGVIGDDAVIGCGSCLVLPVEIGVGAFVAAGSTITDDVPTGALAIAREYQTNRNGWAARRKNHGKHI